MDKTRQKEVREKPEKICTIGYKRGNMDSGCVYGDIFDKLEPCCDKFKGLFFETGHQKTSNFDSRTDERDGLNLVIRGNALYLVLRISLSRGIIYEEVVNVCPFCGIRVDVKCTKVVKLIPKKVEVFQGYEEQIKWQEGGVGQ